VLSVFIEAPAVDKDLQRWLKKQPHVDNTSQCAKSARRIGCMHLKTQKELQRCTLQASQSAIEDRSGRGLDMRNAQPAGIAKSVMKASTVAKRLMAIGSCASHYSAGELRGQDRSKIGRLWKSLGTDHGPHSFAIYKVAAASSFQMWAASLVFTPLLHTPLVPEKSCVPFTHLSR
jgi:hypothetical protein